ncbi:MAG: biotin/lipoyl-containing protein [Chloroflexota bacterium]
MSGPRLRPPMIAGPTDAGEPAATTPPVDPRAVRVGIAAATRLEGDPAFSLAPWPEAVLRPAPAEEPAGDPAGDPAAAPAGTDLLVDGVPIRLRLHRFDGVRARLEEEGHGGTARTSVLFVAVTVDRGRGTEVREVIVGGWRIEVEVESERRAALRERARRGAGAASQGGPVEVRAIFPGRIVAVSVGPGDDVEAGQHILVVEAMKMQNELRAPREGTVERVGVAVGDTIEVGDLLVVFR